MSGNVDSQVANYQPYGHAEFDINSFLREGRKSGYTISASDGKPFLVRYDEPLIKDGKLYSLVIKLVDSSINKKDIIRPSYVSETFSHFFGQNANTSEDGSVINEEGVVVAEIALRADETGHFFLIDDLNYKHINYYILNRYYGSHKGQYNYIGRTMVGIAGRVLKDFYGAKFLAVETDKTKGFYWEISGHPPEKPNLQMITRHLSSIESVEIRKEIRENLYTSIIRNIILQRFDPYFSADSCDFNKELSWEIHCSKIHNVLKDNKQILDRFLSLTGNPSITKCVDEFVNQLIMDYRSENLVWYNSISNKMFKLIEAQRSGKKNQRDRLIEDLISLEMDPIVKDWLNNSKELEVTVDYVSIMKKMLIRLNGKFPIFNLTKIDDIKIGIKALQEDHAV